MNNTMTLTYNAQTHRYDVEFEGDWGEYGNSTQDPKVALECIHNNLHLVSEDIAAEHEFGNEE